MFTMSSSRSFFRTDTVDVTTVKGTVAASPVAVDEDELLEGAAADAASETQKMVQRFEAERLEKRRRRYHAVTSKGNVVLSVGGFIYVASVVMKGLDSTILFYGEMVSALGIFFLTAGIVMMCTCPLDELDFDVFLETNTKNRLLMGFLIFVVALANVSIIPTVIFAVPGMLIMCGGKQVHERHKPRSTTLLQMWFAGDLIGSGIRKYRNAFPSVKPEYAQCERDAYFWHGLAYLFTILPYLATLVRSRMRGNYTVALYDATFAWLLCMSAVTLQLSVFYCQCSTESLQWFALPALCKALAYGVPTSLVRYYGRDGMFLKMAKIIDNEASEEYGAFMSEVLNSSGVVAVGDVWYVHRDEPLDMFGALDPRRNWKRGKVVQIAKEHFTVKLDKYDFDHTSESKKSVGKNGSFWSSGSGTSGSMFTRSGGSNSRGLASGSAVHPSPKPKRLSSGPKGIPKRLSGGPKGTQKMARQRTGWVQGDEGQKQLGTGHTITAVNDFSEGCEDGVAEEKGESKGGASDGAADAKAKAKEMRALKRKKSEFVKALAPGQATLQGKVAQTSAVASDLAFIPMANQSTPSEELLELARKNLRCIEWEDISLELMSGAILSGAVAAARSLPGGGKMKGGGGSGADEEDDTEPIAIDNLYVLSRAVRQNEQIDFFMSHSWHDDAELKYAQLNAIAEEFKAKEGRYPTFWLDKVCIDQQNIADGLKVLPINVMSCRKMLVICGPTYPNRLWCAWELCTLFSFMREEQALDRVDMVALTQEAEAVEENMNVLSAFDVANAHCYDPNEEAKLRRVITAVGEDQFNERVRALAKKCKSRHVKRMRLSAAARRAKDVERMKAIIEGAVEKKLEPVVSGMDELKLTLGQTISEVVKLKAQVLDLKQGQKEIRREQRDVLGAQLSSMSEDLAKLRKGLKAE